jgi:hypothetical protein
VVTRTWTLPDGSTFEGPRVPRRFEAPGFYRQPFAQSGHAGDRGSARHLERQLPLLQPRAGAGLEQRRADRRQRCTQVYEMAEPAVTTWTDNYLCH